MTAMKRFCWLVAAWAVTGCGGSMGERAVPDTIPASGGAITVSPITHGTVQIAHGEHVVLVDPTRIAGFDGAWGREMNYEGLPPATIILITDDHGDHFDAEAIAALSAPDATVVVPTKLGAQVPGAITMANGETRLIKGVTVDAVPMYNIQRGSPPFHRKGSGNGYVLTLGGQRIYIAGDTECTEEMKALQTIDIAFLPMNLPYTMPPDEAAECAAAFKPGIVYPYHYSGQDPQAFATALEGSGIDVRIRDWY